MKELKGLSKKTLPTKDTKQKSKKIENDGSLYVRIINPLYLTSELQIPKSRCHRSLSVSLSISIGAQHYFNSPLSPPHNS
jgi:hypothetical protein